MDDLRKLSDPKRMSAVRRTGLLDTGSEPDFDQLTRMAARLLGAPSAFVTVISDERQFIKSASENGAPSELAGVSQPLSMSFCKHAVAANQPLVVENAREHPVLKDNDAVDAGVIAYAGIPLETEDGQAIGALCVVDSKPRAWSPEDIEGLRALARSAMKLIDERTPAGDGGEGQVGDGLLACVELHLRASDTYARLVRGSKELDFAEEAKARGDLVRTLGGLRDHYNQNASADEELRQAVGRYLQADETRGAATRQFANGEIDLPVLESAIRQHMDSTDYLRLIALNQGADL
ncbi:GAF domain-containing protein [Sphingomonas piscis]|uniref:GAF domain-containing protein n=1 Tax=Sphingomonas piscis TaxID=2714943 RepID=A0A6G7YRS5_9SPHN|nr:GAF domain-containing protein [Sphingomonas piscis]QIK79448.1 GAF domain-containing protein [Sphingomonas piscis]